MTRAQALTATAAIIARSVPDLRTLVGFLEVAGQARLAVAIRKQVEAPTIGGQPKPDPELWRRGSL